MRIGELAERAGTTTRTLRYYVWAGLLPARRPVNGYRTYDEGDLRLVRQIRTLQDFGFGLEETRPFVECLRAGLKAFGNDAKSQIHVYEGMPHAFNADYRPSYRKEAAQDGWKRMLAWFKKHGVA